MENQELAKIFYEIADYLAMEEVVFKPQAYQKAGLVLESLEEDIEKIYQQGGIKALEAISGIGKSIAEKIEEYLKTGKIKYYQELKKKDAFQPGRNSWCRRTGAEESQNTLSKIRD